MYKLIVHVIDAEMIEVDKKVIQNGKEVKIKTKAPRTTVTKMCKNLKDETEFLWMYKDNIKSTRRQYFRK